MRVNRENDFSRTTRAIVTVLIKSQLVDSVA
jgi:hypothetical protein